MQEIILFILSFVFILVLYEIFIVAKAKKNVKKGKKTRNKDVENYAVKNKEGNVVYLDKIPVEIKYLITKYGLQLNNVDYFKLLQVCSIVSSFDMAFIVSLAMIFDNGLLQLLVVAVLVIPVILISYHVVYLIYKKKGLI